MLYQTLAVSFGQHTSLPSVQDSPQTQPPQTRKKTIPYITPKQPDQNKENSQAPMIVPPWFK